MLRPFGFMSGASAAPAGWRVGYVTGWDDWYSTTGDAGVDWNEVALGLKWDDTDYAYNEGSGDGTNSGCTFAMESITDPGQDTGFSYKIKHEGRTAGGEDLRIRLYDQDGDLIDTATPSLILNTPTEETIAIPSSAIANITDFSAVQLNVLNIHPDSVRIYYLYIDTP